MFKVKLQTMGKEYSQTANSINEALVNMGLSWENIKGKGVITIIKGKQIHEHLFNVIQLRRIFGNKLMRAKWTSNLEFLLKSEVKTNIPK